MRKSCLRSLKRVILGRFLGGAAILLLSCDLQASDHVVAIDVSGSMRWDRQGNRIPPGSSTESRIDIVKPAMRDYVAALPDDSRLFLVAFHSGVVREKEFLLSRKGDRDAAKAWVNALDPPNDSKTYLYETIRRVLLKAREYTATSGDDWVNVRVITDGENDHPGSALTLKEVLDGFPEIQQGLMLPDLILLGSLTTQFKDARINVIRDPDLDPFPPVIKWAPDPAIVGQEITFFDGSKSVFQSHKWFVNAKPVGEEKTIKHKFTEPGRYIVRLDVGRGNGSRDKAQAIVIVGTSPIKAEFYIPSEIIAGRQAEFIDRSTGEVDARQWKLDGKSSSSERDFIFTFEDEGSHELTLEITGKNGQKDTVSRSLAILSPPPPSPPPAAGIRTVGEKFKAGEVVQFMDESSGLIETYTWRFDGEASSTEKNPVYVFKSAGQYSVTLNVQGPGGDAKTSTTIEVLPQGPTVSVAAEPANGTVPFEVRFSAKIDGAYESIEWDFGDGDTSLELNPVHTYDQPGDYSAKAILKSVGEESTVMITSSPVGIQAKAPMPLWMKILIGIGGFVAFWIFGMVPFFLKPFFSLAEKRGGKEFRLKPERGGPISMGQVYRSHKGTNWLWPRRHAIVGGDLKDDIRLPIGVATSLAVIRRIPFQTRFVLIPLSQGSIKQRRTSLRLGEQTIMEVAIEGATSLADSDEFSIKTATVKWEEKA